MGGGGGGGGVAAPAAGGGGANYDSRLGECVVMLHIWDLITILSWLLFRLICCESKIRGTGRKDYDCMKLCAKWDKACP